MSAIIYGNTNPAAYDPANNVPVKVDTNGVIQGASSPVENAEVSLLASSSRTATVSTSDQTNYTHRGIAVVLDVTTPGTGSITLKIEGKDPVSGKYYTLLTGAAVTTTTTNVYRVYPGATVTANVSANDNLPKTWRVTVTHNNANAITYSVGASVLL